MVGGSTGASADGDGASGVAVSVIIPVRNGAATIGRQLDALAHQQFGGSFEVIVVDNGSTDGTADVVRAFEGRLPVTVVVGPAQPNRSLARNVGAAAAHASVLAFCDADDEVEPRWLASLYRNIESHGVVTGANVRSLQGQLDASSDRTGQRPTFRGLTTLASGNFAIVRDVYQDVGGFRPDVVNRVDTELTCRLVTRGIDVHFEPEARIAYLRRAALLDEMRQSYRWAVAGAQIYKEYRDRIEFAYSWRNSLKHWMLLVPNAVASIRDRSRRRGVACTLATLSGQLVGSIRYRILYI